MRSCVKLGHELSTSFTEGQGIRQGGLTSADLFKSRSNAALKRLSDLPTTFRIGVTPIGAPTTADDIALLSSTHVGTQSQINLVEADARDQRYCFSSTKTCAQTVNAAPNHDSPCFRLNGDPVLTSTKEKHLGIQRTTDTKPISTIEERIRAGRRTVYSLMGAGLHGLNGVGPKTARKLIDCYVLPVILHGLEALCLSEQDCLPLENYYRNLLRQIQHLPSSTAKPAVYLLMGCIPITGLLHIKVLTFFINILLQPNSILATIMKRQIAVKNLNSHSWTSHVRLLLNKYDLPSAHSLVQYTPRKAYWSRLVKTAVQETWLKQLKSQASRKSTLQLLNLEVCSFGMVHPVWNHSADPLQGHMASTKAKLMVQRYPLTTSHCAGKHRSETCPLCREKSETLQHFLLECPALVTTRQPFLQKFLLNLQQAGLPPPANNQTLLQLLLDCTKELHYGNDDLVKSLETASRKLCFALHDDRSVILGQGPQFTLARRKIRN
jgi:hypothetical protein